MFSLLHQPFPRESSLKKQFRNAIVGGLIVTIFLRVFSPFGFANAPIQNLNLFALGYGIVTAFIVLLIGFFEFAFPFLFKEERWTIGKNILVYIVLIFLIGSANLFYTSITTQLPISLRTFLTFQFFTISVSLVVVSAMTMIRYFRSLKFYREDAVKADSEVHQLKPSKVEMIINIKSENEKENFQLALNDLIYIEAADNYSKIIFRNDNKITSTMIRSSLKRLEEQLPYPELYRCHRTYIVQLRNVEHVSGNSQGYRLHLKHMQHSIPVSRNAGKAVHLRIGQLVN